MATIQSTFAMEDRVSSTLERIEHAMNSTTQASDKMKQSYMDISAAEANLFMQNTEFEDGLQRNNDLVRQAAETGQYRIETNERVAESIERTAQAEEYAMSTTEFYKATLAELRDTTERTAEGSELMTRAVDQKVAALERSQQMMELASQRVEQYETKLQDVALQIQATEMVLAELNREQEHSFSEKRQNEILQYSDKLERLNYQYEQTNIRVQQAQNQHANAFARMGQAQMRLNPMVQGLNSGFGAMGGAAAQFGRIGTQAFGQIASGAGMAKAAQIALNAAIGVGMALAMTALVGFIKKQRESREETERQRQEQLRLGQAYRNSIQSITRGGFIGNMMANVAVMQSLGNEIKELAPAAINSADEVDKLATAVRQFEDMTGMEFDIDYDSTDSLMEFYAEMAVIDDVIDKYAELAIAKATLGAYEGRLQRAIEEQFEIEDKIRALQSPIEEAKRAMQIMQDYEPNFAQFVLGELGWGDALETLGIGGAFGNLDFMDYGEAIAEAEREIANEIAKLEGEYKKAGDDAANFADALVNATRTVESLFGQLSTMGADPSRLESSPTDNLLAGLNDKWNRATTRGGRALRTDSDVTFKEEDLQMLHDISRREYYVRYQQLTPQVSFSIQNVNENADLDLLADKVAGAIVETAESRLDVGVQR